MQEQSQDQPPLQPPQPQQPFTPPQPNIPTPTPTPQYSQPATAVIPGKGMGIVGFIFAFVGLQVPGLILSIISFNKAKKAGFKNALSLWGIILNSIFIVIVIILIGVSISNETKSTTPTVTKADVVTKMNMIQGQLSASWKVCQIDPTKCSSSVAQIGSAEDVFNNNSSQFKTKSLDDFTGWKQNVGLTEGDIKQWAVNTTFNKDNTLLSTSIPKEIQDDQDMISSFAGNN